MCEKEKIAAPSLQPRHFLTMGSKATETEN